MNELMEMIINWQFLLVAAACGALGVVIKGVPKLPSWIIPFVNTVFAVVFMMLLKGFLPEYALVGFLAAAVAGFIYEYVTQLIKNVIPNNRQVFGEPALKDNLYKGQS